MRANFPTFSAVILASTVLLLTACGDEGGNKSVPNPSGNDDTGGGEMPADTHQPPTDEGTTTGDLPPAGANALSFEQTTDGTGQPCTNKCTQPLEPGQSFEIVVYYKGADGAAINEAQVVFETTAGEDQIKLGAKNAYTDANGRASVSVTAQAAAAGNFDVRISALGDADAGTLIQQIFVNAAVIPPLTVDVEYTGTQSVSAFELRFFLQEGGKPICSDVHPDTPGAKPTPVMKQGGVGVTQVVSISALPGLDDAGTQMWMVQALGPEGTSPSVNGCTAGVEVTSGKTADTIVNVVDLPKQFAGTYDATTWADMHTGLSGGAGTAVELLVGLFTNPGETAIKFACANASGELKTVCGFLVDGGGNLSGAGIAIAQTADEIFLELMQDQLGDNVFFTGNSLGELLKTMRFGSQITFDAEPVADTGGQGAVFPLGTASEEWVTATFQWKFDQTLCPPGTEDCPKTVKLENVYQKKLTASLNGGVTAKEEVWIEKHAVSGFNYGVLVNFIVEKQVLPLLFGDGTEPGPQGGNLPPIDSYDKVIATIFGDNVCLYYDDCCDFFLQKEGVQSFITDYTGGNPILVAIAESIALAACNAAPGAGGSWIRNQLIGLGADLQIGTPGDKACPGIDQNGDRTIDNLGQESNRCEWDATWDFVGQSFEPDNSWFGKHK